MVQNPENRAPWLHGHAHEPNPTPPPGDGNFVLWRLDHKPATVHLAALYTLPVCQVSDCYITSTGHGVSGPFTFTGARLHDLLEQHLGQSIPWVYTDIISADGFGTRLSIDELRRPTDRPILLSYATDGVAMTRTQGLVRLIVPTDTDDALRQVKWVAHIHIHQK